MPPTPCNMQRATDTMPHATCNVIMSRVACCDVIVSGRMLRRDRIGLHVAWHVGCASVCLDVFSGPCLPGRLRRSVWFPSLGSRDTPTQNADGSTSIYLGPKTPAGKEGNWLATVPGKGYFVVLRLYGPTAAAIDKSWKPGDIEKVP